MNKVEILVTGSKFLGNGIRGIEPVIEELITKAEKEIQIVAYIFTPSAFYLMDLIEAAAARGVRVKFLINSFEMLDSEVKPRMLELSRAGNVKIFNFSGHNRQLHAKVFVTDRKRAVVGSANLSWGGMQGNYEIGLLVEGDEVWKLASLIDNLVSESSMI